jgi:hypothetical protein
MKQLLPAAKKFRKSLIGTIDNDHALPNTAASSAILIYMPFLTWRKLAARGSVSTA